MQKDRKFLSVKATSFDSSTGEYSEVVNNYFISKGGEQFAMYRTTDGLEWIKPLKNLIPCLMIMTFWANKSDGITNLSQVRRNELCEFLDLKNNESLTGIFAKCIKRNGMVRVAGSNSDFMVNPMCFFKGKSYELKNRMDRYNSYLPKRKNEFE